MQPKPDEIDWNGSGSNAVDREGSKAAGDHVIPMVAGGLSGDPTKCVFATGGLNSTCIFSFSAPSRGAKKVSQREP